MDSTLFSGAKVTMQQKKTGAQEVPYGPQEASKGGWGCTKRWEGAKTGQLTTTGQRDVHYHTVWEHSSGSSWASVSGW